MHAWILALLALVATPESQRDRFGEIATAIETAASARPLYSSDDGPQRTVAELVALAARESHLVVQAVGYDDYGRSFGLFQVHETNFDRLGVMAEETSDPMEAVSMALTLLAESHRVCRARPSEEQLSEYASGMGRCDTPEGIRDSRNRMHLASWLLKTRPPFWTSRSASVLEVRTKRSVQ